MDERRTDMDETASRNCSRGMWTWMCVGLLFGFVLGLVVAVTAFKASEVSRAAESAIGLKLERRVDSARNDVEALADDVLVLKKFKADCDAVVPALAAKLDRLEKVHVEKAREVDQAFAQQRMDVAVLARVLSDKFGQEAWMAMVGKAQRAVNGQPEPEEKGSLGAVKAL